MKSKGLVIGIVVAVALLGAVYALTGNSPQPVEGTETPAEVAAAAPEAAPAENAAEPAATEPAAQAEEAAGDLTAAPGVMQIDIAKATADRVLGNPAAPVTIIEYASMTCSHCATFHNTVLPDVKKQLIETGKARFIFRDFPLDGFALKAAKMARCADDSKYFDLVEVIFKNQERWTKADNPLKALEQYGALAGMDPDYIRACMDDVRLDDFIINGQKVAQEKYGLQSTPTFVFNEGVETFSGAQPATKFLDTVNKLSAE